MKIKYLLVFALGFIANSAARQMATIEFNRIDAEATINKLSHAEMIEQAKSSRVLYLLRAVTAVPNWNIYDGMCNQEVYSYDDINIVCKYYVWNGVDLRKKDGMK